MKKIFRINVLLRIVINKRGDSGFVTRIQKKSYQGCVPADTFFSWNFFFIRVKKHKKRIFFTH